MKMEMEKIAAHVKKLDKIIPRLQASHDSGRLVTTFVFNREDVMTILSTLLAVRESAP